MFENYSKSLIFYNIANFEVFEFSRLFLFAKVYPFNNWLLPKLAPFCKQNRDNFPLLENGLNATFLVIFKHCDMVLSVLIKNKWNHQRLDRRLPKPVCQGVLPCPINEFWRVAGVSDKWRQRDYSLLPYIPNFLKSQPKDVTTDRLPFPKRTDITKEDTLFKRTFLC